jgi:hypothetical protein
MPRGPTPKAPDYDDDFYTWTQHQAVVLREIPMTDNRFDRKHVFEQIEDLGKNERDAARSQVHRTIEFFLKPQYSPATPRPRSMASINDARGILGGKLGGTLRQDIEARLTALYEAARSQAELGLPEDGEAAAAPLFPVNCPGSFDRILPRRWYPEPLETP